MESEPLLSPDVSLNLLGRAECPVCAAPFFNPSDRVPGVETQVVHCDRRVMEHLAAHTARELAFAYLVTDARLAFARNDMAPDTAARYDEAVLALAADYRAELLG
jgi:hypothetical protein